MNFVRTRLWIVLVCVLTAQVSPTAEKTIDNETQAFAEPYRTIDVAAVEAGLLTNLLVEEGASVEKQQPLAELHQDVLKSTLEIARLQRDAIGALQGAEAELRLRENLWKKLKELRRDEHASEEELRRAELEYELAQSRVLQAREQIEIKRVEYERAELQLAQRTIRSPISGVVTHLHKDAGEFLSPTDPVVVTVAQLDPLTVTFSIPVSLLSGITQGQKIPLRIDGLKQPRNAEVELVSSVINAESQTVRVKFKLANPNKELRSGVKCFLSLTDTNKSFVEQPARSVTKFRN